MVEYGSLEHFVFSCSHMAMEIIEFHDEITGTVGPEFALTVNVRPDKAWLAVLPSANP